MRVPTRPNINKRARLLMVLACLFTIPAVQAAEGRIDFSGTVLAPSCALTAVQVQQALQAHVLEARRDCVGKDGHRAQAPGDYRLRFTQLTTGMIDARVQAYVSSLAIGHGIDHGTGMLLATQIYQ